MVIVSVTGAADRELHVHRDDGRPVLTHRIHRGHRPYIHPIHAPDGRGVMTEDRPDHHPWQHGLYTGLNLVNGAGFWKEFDHDGRIDPTLVGEPGTDGDAARWEISATWITPKGEHLVTESQQWALRVTDDAYTLDLTWTLHAEVDLVMGQYMAGGLFLRMPWRAETGGRAVNSDGLANDAAEKQRARWLAVAMPLADRDDRAGMALLDHPANPDHPVTWRVDGELGISPSRCIAGPWSVPQGADDRYRYRIAVFCGAGSPETIDRQWHTFAGE